MIHRIVLREYWFPVYEYVKVVFLYSVKGGYVWVREGRYSEKNDDRKKTRGTEKSEKNN